MSHLAVWLSFFLILFLLYFFFYKNVWQEQYFYIILNLSQPSVILFSIFLNIFYQKKLNVPPCVGLSVCSCEWVGLWMFEFILKRKTKKNEILTSAEQTVKVDWEINDGARKWAWSVRLQALSLTIFFSLSLSLSKLSAYCSSTESPWEDFAKGNSSDRRCTFFSVWGLFLIGKKSVFNDNLWSKFCQLDRIL